MNSLHLKRAVQCCEKGGVIAYPTEAVFGLGCLPLLKESVTKILQLKDRPVEKGLILVASDIEQLHEFVDFNEIENTQVIYESWPGPVTWLIPAKSPTPDWLTGKHTTLAVRVSAQPIVRALCEQLGPIVSTSANPASAEPAKTSDEVRNYFRSRVDYVIPANISNNLSPTEIRDAQTGNIVRSG
jgi:L-threonylcarbamoyladenylate synthase